MGDRENSFETAPIESSLTDRTLRRLFSEAKKAIEHFNLERLLDKVHNVRRYHSLYVVAETIAKKIDGRVTITLPDGQVVIDTCKEGNTFDNYMDDAISENHNTRVAIFQAQYEQSGVGYERKFSSTTQRKESYLAMRLGQFRNSAGTLRLSVTE